MALAKVISGATVGLEPVPVTVEVNIEEFGFPAFKIVGLPDKAVEESKERVRSALKNSGADFPRHRITVNLAPADLPKQGPAYDLPIALGILLAGGQLVADVSKFLVFGELSLDGSLRSTPGMLPMALLAKNEDLTHLVIPSVNAPEAAVVPGVSVLPVPSLTTLFSHLSQPSRQVIDPYPPSDFSSLIEEADKGAEVDFADVRGQVGAKRALEIAAAGGHNVLMYGSPGMGKTMLARAFVSILPRLAVEEALEVTKIYSVTGNLSEKQPVIRTRPFRAPHHTTSRVGLIGGGTHPSPGEVSLAHRGVLFLDEFPEFPRSVLESLRQPLEDGLVTVSRAAGSLTFPAKFILIAAQNPCQCGFDGDPKRACTCSPGQLERYRRRVSGPLLDRIDLHVNVPSVELSKLTTQTEVREESSAQIRERVQRARDRQRERFAETNLICNAEMGTRMVKRWCPVGKEEEAFLQQAARSMRLSARGYYRTLRVARTIADSASSENIQRGHLSEALQFRRRERL